MASTRLTVAAHESFPEALLDGAIPNGDSGLLIASGMTDFSRALMTAERDHSEAMLLFTPTVEDVSQLLATARDSKPDMALVVALPGPANGSIAEAITAGAHEIVILPAERASIGGAVHKALARLSTAPPAAGRTAHHAPTIVVLGPKGGAGKTTVTTNLAVHFAAEGRRVLVIDVDLQFGDVGLMLGISPDRTIHDLVTAPGRLDGEKLRGFLGQSEDGVHALLAPLRPDQGDAVTRDAFEEILQVAVGEFDVVLVDTPPAFTAATIIAVDHADRVLMVGTLDLPGLKNLKVGMETLELMGVPRDRLTVVMNRADSKVGLSDGDVRDVLHGPPDAAIPSDRAVPRAVNSARPIIAGDPKAAPAKALRNIGERLSAVLFGEEA
jgi:pilus assembly protein CpaE